MSKCFLLLDNKPTPQREITNFTEKRSIKKSHYVIRIKFEHTRTNPVTLFNDQTLVNGY